MKNRSVNINIDYKTGKCVLTSKIKGKVETMEVQISKLNSFWHKYNRGYKSDFIEFGREEMERDISQITEKYPDLKYSKDLIKNADPLIYELLYDWDLKHADPEKDVSYSLDYLKTVIQKFDDNDFSKSTKGSLEEKSKRVRKKNLKNAGIKITYDVGLFNADSSISLMDRIRGIKIAKKQEELYGVKLNNNFIMKKDKNKKGLFSILKQKIAEVKNEKTRFVRSLESKEDSIYNKKYVPDKSKTRQRILKGVATAMAIGSIANIGAINHIMNEHKEHSNDDLVFSEQIKTNMTKKENVEKNENTNIFDKDNSNEIVVNIETIKLTDDEKESAKKEVKKSDGEKISEFKEMAEKRYMDEFTIGDSPKVGNMLDFYTENPDGSGNIGYFKTQPDYKISHINIMTKEGYKTIRDNGENLNEILDKYSDCTDYSIHFENSKTGGGLGFVTKSHLNSLIEKKVDSIVQSKTDKNQELDYDDLLM